MKKFSNFKFRKGFAAFFITILIMFVILGIAISIFVLTYGEQKIISNITKSSQAYFLAEAGIEDALLRLSQRMNWTSPSTLNFDKGTANIQISSLIGGSRIITSQGDVNNRIRKLSIVYAVNTEKVVFHYGAQVGKGGMIMETNSKVIGNVFSNGTVNCPSVVPLEVAYITNSVIVAGNGRKIEKLEIGDPNPLTPIDEAHAHICNGCIVHGILYYVAPALGGSKGDCAADDGFQVHPNLIAERDMPISDTQIQTWKDEASCNNDPNCIFLGNYTIPIGATDFLGPLRIEGDLFINNNATLKMTGTIHVTGNIFIDQNAIIELDPNYYGSLSGLIISDGKIDVENNAVVQGSGLAGSYTMLISTDSSLNEDDAAIDVKNSAIGAIFYTTDGVIRLRNNMKIREATGYKVYLDNNAEIEYETGLEDATFTSGPGGSWEVTEWKEIP